MTVTESSITGDSSGNKNSNNTNNSNNANTNNSNNTSNSNNTNSSNNTTINNTTINNTNVTTTRGLPVSSDVPSTFEDLLKRPGWVSPPKIDLEHLCDQYNLPEANTGEWIFKEFGYTEWQKRSEHRLLWLCGGPGIGKTMLAKRIAAEFLKGYGDHPKGVKLVFYFMPERPTDGTSADEAKTSPPEDAKVVSDLLCSILQQDRNLFDPCEAELRRQGERFFTNAGSLWKVLKKTIQNCQTDPIYILIDGIDGLKASLCTKLIKRIRELLKIPKVKVLLSSRDVPHVSNNLSEYIDINLDTNDFIKRDVKTFITRRVDALGWRDGDMKERAAKTLWEKSGGSFLWVSLVIEDLNSYSPGPNFDAFLKQLPPGLQETYREMLSPLSRKECETVLTVIQSVALVLRPLTFGEFAHILARTEEKAKTEQRSYGGASTEIREKIEKEISMHVQTSRGFLRATDTTVSIVHHTAVEYLFDENRNDGLPILSKGNAHLEISWECFRYLHHVFGDPSPGRDRQEEEPKEPSWEMARKNPQKATAKWAFLKYAAESWLIHARQSIAISMDKFCDDPAHNWLQHQFFETSDDIRKPWISLSGDQGMEDLAGDQTPAHIAVRLGLMPLVEKDLPDLTEATDSNRSLLLLAAKSPSGAWQTLINKAGILLLTAPDQDGNTLLHKAAILGHPSTLEGMVKRLVESKDRAYHSEIDKKNLAGNTPLHLCIQFDHPSIVYILINNGADPAIKNNAQVTVWEMVSELEREDCSDALKKATQAREGKEVTVEELAEEPVEETVEEPAEEPVEEPVEEPAEEIVEEPAEETAEETVEEPAEEPVEETVEEPAEEPVEEIVDEPAEEPVEEIVEEPAEETAKETVEEPADEIVEETVEEPADEIVEETVEEPTEEPTEEPAPPQAPQPKILAQAETGAWYRVPKISESKIPAKPWYARRLLLCIRMRISILVIIVIFVAVL